MTLIPNAFISKKTPIISGLLIVVLSLFSQFTSVEPLNEWRTRLELLTYDLRMNLFLKENIKKDDRIVIVDIDEKSLAKEGRWPWSRKKIAKLVNELSASGAIVIAFDVSFTEPERNSSDNVLEQLNPADIRSPVVREYLKEYRDKFDSDNIFAQSLKNKDIVLGYITFIADNGNVGLLPNELIIKDKKEFVNTSIINIKSYTANLPSLQKAAINAGYFTLPTTDVDGVIRRFPLISRINDGIYASLPLEIFRLYNLIDSIKLHQNLISDQSVLTGIEVVANQIIPTDGLGQVMVPFRGKAGSYPYVSATDILNKKHSKKDIENKIILIGTTAIGIFDLRSVPVQSVYPGVEIHANILSALLDNSFPSEPAWAPGANFIFMFMVGVILAIGLPFLAPLYQFIFSFLILVGFISINFWLWSDKGLVLSLISPLAMVVGLMLFNFSYGFVIESSGRRNLKQAFGQYIPPELVKQMDVNSTQYGFDGDSREMTVLFSDIVGFTSISEKLTATELKNILNDYLTPMTEVIFNNNGTIDKYIGDLIMAFWGAPIHDSEHANHAVSAAIEMLKRLSFLNKEFTERNLPTLSVGIGINTGDMNVGDMGSTYRRAYTVIGDSVNLASRLEALTRYFDVDILLSESTAVKLNNDYILMKVGKVMVKGKTEAVTIYTVVGETTTIENNLLEKKKEFEIFLNLFSNKEWDNAAKSLVQMEQNYGACKLFSFYQDMIVNSKESMSDEKWYGEIVFSSK